MCHPLTCIIPLIPLKVWISLAQPERDKPRVFLCADGYKSAGGVFFLLKVPQIVWTDSDKTLLSVEL